MAEKEAKAVIMGQLKETQEALDSLKRAYERWVREDFAELGKRPATASLLSDILEVPGVRPRVVSRATFEILREVIRFRHFRRYYYEQDYDWDRPFPLLDADLTRFASFLTAL